MTAYTDSVAAEASLTLQGLWIHDPLDPEGTVQQYLYGKATRSSSVDTLQNGLIYAGRTYPVFDYGEHQQDKYDVSIVVPYDTDWVTNMANLLEFANAKRVLCVRDNRGRKMFGSISDYNENDADHGGTTVSFTMTRADYDESVV